MSWVAFILVLISSSAHAIWNLIGKKASPSIAFFFAMNLVGAVISVPVLWMFPYEISLIPPKIWGILALTGLFQAVYFTGLAGAYQNGDMSVAYPLARSSPVLVVTFVSVILGRGHQITAACFIGIGLVLAGCFLIPMKAFSDFKFKNYLNSTCALAFVAACGTAGYSIADDEALRMLRQTYMSGSNKTVIPLVYCSLEVLFTVPWLLIPLLFSNTERAALAALLRHGKFTGASAGVIMFFTYLMILVSMAFVQNVSYIVAFRQISILIGVCLGIVCLREKPYRPKLAGSLIVFCGLVLVGMG